MVLLAQFTAFCPRDPVRGHGNLKPATRHDVLALPRSTVFGGGNAGRPGRYALERNHRRSLPPSVAPRPALDIREGDREGYSPQLPSIIG